MSGLEWLAVGVGSSLFVIALLLCSLRRARQQNQKLSKRVDQLSIRLHEQIAEQSSEQSLDSCNVTNQILQSLRETRNRPGMVQSSTQSSEVSSINPMQESVEVLSKRLARLESCQKSQNNSNVLNLASLAVIYIRNHISEVIRVIEMAQALQVSKSTLYHCLKESLGCSAQDLINVIKMQEAKRLLRTGDLLVKEVAFQLGYWSPYHFSSRFRVFFGLSPRHFKQHYQLHRQKNSVKYVSEAPVDKEPKQYSHDDQGEIKVQWVEHKEIQTPQTLSAGTEIDRFVVMKQIGRGGMGEVYKAYDPKLNRGVALKLIRADRATSVQLKNRLIREAQALAQLSHPNVLHVYDVGTFGDQVFMTMALVEGQTLKNWLKAQPRSVDEILGVMVAAGKGLSAAHKAGLVHRDFKPSNIIVGNDDQVRVLDFGLARSVSTKEDYEDGEQQHRESDSSQDLAGFSTDSRSNLLMTPLTHAGHILGTPLYMAPEQHLGLVTDERTDQFGFCVVLYEALYGKRPFVARSIQELKSEVMRQQVIVPPADSDVPAWLWQIICKGLSVDPDDRYPTIESLLEKLENNPEEIRLQQRLIRRRKLLVLSLIISTIALPIGVWYGLRNRTVHLCKAADGELDGVWDEAIKTTIRKAFLNTKISYASGTLMRVDQNINRYLAEWKKMRSEVCEATWLRGTQSEELFDLKMSCLSACLREVRSLASILTKADSTIVSKAAQASLSLTAITTCADEKDLRSPYSPPKNPQTKMKVDAIREKLSNVVAMYNTGQFQEGLKQIQDLAQETQAIHYLPLQAEVLHRLGAFLYSIGDYESTVTTLYKAALIAGKSRDNHLVAGALSFLLFVVGYSQGRPEDGLLIARDAEIVLELGGGDEQLRAQFFNNMGSVFLRKLDFEKAGEYYKKSIRTWKQVLGPEHFNIAMPLNNLGAVFNLTGEDAEALECNSKALTIMERELGPEHPDVALSLHNLGITFSNLGEFPSALEHFQKALLIERKTLGLEHPLVSETMNFMGQAFWKQGQYDMALNHFQKALVIREKALGPSHPQVAETLADIGSLLVDQGKYFQAIEPLERSLVICEKKTCEPAPHGRALFNLARATAATKGKITRAIKLAKKALKVFGTTPKAVLKELEQVKNWLEKKGEEHRTYSTEQIR